MVGFGLFVQKHFTTITILSIFEKFVYILHFQNIKKKFLVGKCILALPIARFQTRDISFGTSSILIKLKTAAVILIIKENFVNSI